MMDLFIIMTVMSILLLAMLAFVAYVLMVVIYALCGDIILREQRIREAREKHGELEDDGKTVKYHGITYKKK